MTDADFIETLDELHALYGVPGVASTAKVASRLSPGYREWIERARFCILSTVGPEGTDASPRGDDGPVVAILDDRRLALPDWHGNNRIDSLRNIVRDPRMSLMFLVPGSNTVIRVNGTGRVTADAALLAGFDRSGRQPRSVTVIEISEIYFQCARAPLRAELWSGQDQSDGLPTPGDLLSEMSEGQVGGPDYDAEWPGRAAKTMW